MEMDTKGQPANNNNNMKKNNTELTLISITP